MLEYCYVFLGLTSTEYSNWRNRNDGSGYRTKFKQIPRCGFLIYGMAYLFGFKERKDKPEGSGQVVLLVRRDIKVRQRVRPLLKSWMVANKSPFY